MQELLEQLKAQTERLDRLAAAMEQNNHLISQVLQVNAELLESAFGEDDGETEGGAEMYLDGEPVIQN
ncbi:hypothetical protein [Methylophaga sp. OBS4]|uniref:hypothetical protein n=1 Tax=Methylophaga sp. OBS4 TaxID=2991935 RepID=UPI002259AEAF|nr:hypothetical protein [Methylophaga sp. OBS4]MCX4186758.1 hypothetical protein [Methylophaga sp. OBS4]